MLLNSGFTCPPGPSMNPGKKTPSWTVTPRCGGSSATRPAGNAPAASSKASCSLRTASASSLKVGVPQPPSSAAFRCCRRCVSEAAHEAKSWGHCRTPDSTKFRLELGCIPPTDEAPVRFSSQLRGTQPPRCGRLALLGLRVGRQKCLQRRHRLHAQRVICTPQVLPLEPQSGARCSLCH